MLKLGVESGGRGPDLVLLHGWGMNAAVWDKLAPALEPHFRMHRVELAGQRASAARTPYTLDAVADALAAAVPARVAVCGWSLGAHFALTWARRNSPQVMRLVLIAATPRFVSGANWPHGIAAAVFDAFAAELGRDCRAALQRFLALQVRGDLNAHDALRYLRGRVVARGAADRETLTAGLQILKDADLRDLLPHIAQPALLLHGTRDSLVPLAACEFMQRTLPDARLETIAGSAHAPFVTNVEHVASSIKEFCREQ